MTARSLKLTSILGFAFLFSWSSGATAQAYRTFISGIGSDANPCTRALPCQTFTGALAQTHQFGQIYVLDALDQQGTFAGPVTISKSVSIIGAGSRAAISGSLLIAPEAGGEVLLKGLDIIIGGVQVLGTGINLVIDDCTIFNGAILFQPSGTATSNLAVRNSVVSGDTSGTGILIQPQSTGKAVVVLENVNVNNNNFCVRAFDHSTVTVRNSVISENLASGIRADSSGGGVTTTIFVEHSQSSHNGGNGVLAAGTGAAVTISDVTITDNTNGVYYLSGGVVYSFGNNSIAGNTVTLPPTLIPPG
jgi:hypothetical protein